MGLRPYADALVVTRIEEMRVYVGLKDRPPLDVARFAARVLPEMAKQSSRLELVLDPLAPSAVDPALIRVVAGWKVAVERAVDQVAASQRIPSSEREHLRTCTIKDVTGDVIHAHLRGEVAGTTMQMFLRALTAQLRSETSCEWVVHI